MRTYCISSPSVIKNRGDANKARLRAAHPIGLRPGGSGEAGHEHRLGRAEVVGLAGAVGECFVALPQHALDGVAPFRRRALQPGRDHRWRPRVVPIRGLRQGGAGSRRPTRTSRRRRPAIRRTGGPGAEGGRPCSFAGRPGRSEAPDASGAAPAAGAPRIPCARSRPGWPRPWSTRAGCHACAACRAVPWRRVRAGWRHAR